MEGAEGASISYILTKGGSAIQSDADLARSDLCLNDFSNLADFIVSNQPFPWGGLM